MRVVDARLVVEATQFDDVTAIRVEPLGANLPGGFVARHGFQFLTLARQRLADREAGKVDRLCGWLALEQLENPADWNLCAYRLRWGFTRLGFDDAAAIIERRLQDRSIRLGPVEVEVRCIDAMVPHAS